MSSPKTLREWGYYCILYEVPGTKVKELTVNPGCSLSMQRHAYRSEYWHVSEGRCIVNSILDSGYVLPPVTLDIRDSYKIPINNWHQLSNPFAEPCKIVEIQYGTNCTEEDIERK